MRLYNKVSLLILISAIVMSCSGQLKILLSAALTNNVYAEFRQKQYLETFNVLTNFGYKDFYIVEALQKHGPTYLENYCNHVFYATVNNPHLKNNGINEARTILEATYHFNFAPDDMILKCTGRYHFGSDYFLKMIENNSDYDAILRIHAPSGQVYVVCFAMKCKHLQDMYEHLDYHAMEHHWVILEKAVGDYVLQKERQGKFKVLYVPQLDITGSTYGSTTAPGSNEVIHY